MPAGLTKLRESVLRAAELRRAGWGGERMHLSCLRLTDVVVSLFIVLVSIHMDRVSPYEKSGN